MVFIKEQKEILNCFVVEKTGYSSDKMLTLSKGRFGHSSKTKQTPASFGNTAQISFDGAKYRDDPNYKQNSRSESISSAFTCASKLPDDIIQLNAWLILTRERRAAWFPDQDERIIFLSRDLLLLLLVFTFVIVRWDFWYTSIHEK